jgi:hypothetical protein
MASRGQALTIVYHAWDASASAYKTGDVANHTLRVVKDGTSAAPTNSPSEIDATNLPGAYKLTLTTTETAADFVHVGGKSSTANVILLPVAIDFDRLPTNNNMATFFESGGLSDAAWLLSTLFGHVNSIAADVWGESLPGAYTAGQAGYILDAIKDATDTIGALPITTTIPTIDDGGTLEIVRGDDYKIADSRHFTFVVSSATPDLTGATVVLKIRYGDDGDTEYVSGACTLSGEGTATQTIKAELTAAQTALLIPVTYDGEDVDRPYDLEATLSSGRIATLYQGLAVVSKDVR